jgi:hypothetical protein
MGKLKTTKQLKLFIAIPNAHCNIKLAKTYQVNLICTIYRAALEKTA